MQPCPTPPIARLSLLLIFLQTVAAAQVADFSADVTTGCFPLTVNFTDTSTGSPTGWEWTFGNGNSSTLQNPSAVFSAPGMYTVVLTASKGATSNTKTNTGYIKVFGPPEVNFSFDISAGCAPLSVNFNDQTSTASGALTNWFWVFGDGGTSQSANPTYVFLQPGSKTISLKVRNEHGCEQTKMVDTPIDVRGPITDFIPSSDAICSLPAFFTFNNTSTGQGTMSYVWDLGDGKSSTDTSPVNSYNVAGSYDVVLTTTDESGCTTSAGRTIFAGSDDGVNLSTTPALVCPGQPISFTAISVDPISTYEWSFGNGTLSTQISPTTTYAESGVYLVTLKAQLLNHACASIVTREIKISPPAEPSFIKGFDCNLNLTLTSTSTHTTNVEWFINDVLVSTASKFVSPIHLPGNQTVRLVAYNDAGCPYEKEEVATLMETPIARFTPNGDFNCKGKAELAGCAPYAVNFVNGSTPTTTTTYRWEFGDGGTSTLAQPSHVFNTRGTFQVKLTASNPRGCSTAASAIAKVSDSAPIADFTYDRAVACPGELITFVDVSQNAEARCWDFGDGWAADAPAVAHAYSLPGTYTVTLTSKNGCTTIVKKTNIITIKEPTITFGFSKTCGDPFNVQLNNMSSNYDELQWDFGDGQTSTVYDPGTHHYATEGEYELKLIGKSNETGCTVIAVAPLKIQQVTANFIVDHSKPCAGVPIHFTDASHAAVKWNWKLGPYTSKQKDFSATLYTPGIYTATLEVKDSDSCKAVKEVPIEVINMKGDFSFTATSTCSSFIVEFEDESTGTPAPTNWLWTFGDGSTSTDRNPIHAYHDPGSYNVELSISNSQGSCTFKKDDAVDFRIPIPDFATAKSKFCVGDVVTFANTSSNSSQFKWFFGDGSSSEIQSPEVAFSAPGSYTVTLVATDAYGCEQRVIKTNFVNIVKAVANFSVDKTTGSCPPFTATFQDKSSADITNWQWDFGDGHTSTVQNPVNIYALPGAFNITLRVTDANGCEGLKEAAQFVTVGGPSGAFTASGWGTCTTQDVTFTAIALNTAKMTWDFGDGVVMDQMTTPFVHKYNSLGRFTPSLLLTDANGCKVLASGSSEIFVKGFTPITTSVEPSCVTEGDPVILSGEAHSGDEVTWVWAVDGSQSLYGKQIETAIYEPGLHTVIGWAINEWGCASSESREVRVQGSTEIVPNVITPDGDHLNQYFTFEGFTPREWDFGVIDRWGKEVYKEENYLGTWDANGLPGGVYYFVLSNKYCEGLDYKGVISVVR